MRLDSGKFRGTPRLQLPIRIDRNSAQPLTKQLIELLRSAVLNGQLAPNTRLPSTRAMAADLKVSRTVTSVAYDQLIAEGYFDARRGSGTYVKAISSPLTATSPSSTIPVRALVATNPDSETAGGAFRTGTTTANGTQSGFDKALRAAARAQLPGRYLSSQGEPKLRAAMAEYLIRSRGLLADPDQIVLTSGTKQSTDLLLRVLAKRDDFIGVEEPSYPWLRDLIGKHGMHSVGIPVDADGANIRQAPKGRTPRLVHVSPSHQFPLGAAMKVARRLDLIDWAHESDGYVLEDDYDSEFRFGAEPLPPLASLGPERVVYLGTMSKVLTPALRCGLIVAENSLAKELTGWKDTVDGAMAWPVQQVVLELLESGDLERHVRRMRIRYARVRNGLRAGLQPLEDVVEISGIDAGLHLVILPRSPLNVERIAARAAAAGVAIATLRDFYFTMPPRLGLLLGYGSLDEDEIKAACALICDLILDEASR